MDSGVVRGDPEALFALSLEKYTSFWEHTTQFTRHRKAFGMEDKRSHQSQPPALLRTSQPLTPHTEPNHANSPEDAGFESERQFERQI